MATAAAHAARLPPGTLMLGMLTEGMLTVGMPIARLPTPPGVPQPSAKPAVRHDSHQPMWCSVSGVH